MASTSGASPVSFLGLVLVIAFVAVLQDGKGLAVFGLHQPRRHLRRTAVRYRHHTARQHHFLRVKGLCRLLDGFDTAFQRVQLGLVGLNLWVAFGVGVNDLGQLVVLHTQRREFRLFGLAQVAPHRMDAPEPATVNERAVEADFDPFPTQRAQRVGHSLKPLAGKLHQQGPVGQERQVFIGEEVTQYPAPAAS